MDSGTNEVMVVFVNMMGNNVSVLSDGMNIQSHVICHFLGQKMPFSGEFKAVFVQNSCF